MDRGKKEGKGRAGMRAEEEQKTSKHEEEGSKEGRKTINNE